MPGQTLTVFDIVGMTANGTGLPVTTRIDYAQGNTGVSQDLADGNGNRGSLDRRENRMRVVRGLIQPSLDFEPTPDEWANLLPWLLGGTNGASGGVTTYAAGNDAPQRYIQLREDRVGDGTESITHTLGGVMVDSFTIRAGASDPILGLSTQLLGNSYSTGTVFPDTLEQDADLDNAKSPFTFADTTAAGTPAGAMTIGGVEREVFDFSLNVNYNIDRNRFANSLFLQATRKRERIVTVSITVVPEVAEALCSATLPTLTDRSFVVRFTNGSTYLEINLGGTLWPKQPQPRPRRGESLIPLTGQAFMTDSAAALAMKLKP
jgi:hypothetical protein